MSESRICTWCKVEQTVAHYRWSRGKMRSHCVHCHRAHMKRYCRAKYATPLGRAKQLFGNLCQRAKKKQTSVTVSVEHLFVLVKMGYCQKSGLPFNLSTPDSTHFNPFSPSVDRINNAKAYDTDNIQMVCNMYNMGKSDNSELDFIAMCCAVAERHASDPAVVQRLKEIRNAEF